MEEDKVPATEANELELLERVFLRLGVAESDAQLEKVLGRFLPPVLLKGASPSPAVRSKVMELLTHISRRLKSRPEVQLPVEQLLLQFTDPSSPPAVVNFSLVYLRQGCPRLPPSEQARLLPVLLLCLPNCSAQQQDSILQFCVPALIHLEWPRDLQEKKALLPLADHPAVRKLLLQFLLPYLLLPYGPLDLKPGQPSPPGLSRGLITKLIGGAPPSTEQLEQRKIAILKLLSSEVLPADEVVCHLIGASGDPKSSVSEMAEKHLKQFSHGLSWETPSLVAQLLTLFLGTAATPGKRPHPKSPSPQDAMSPANLRVRMKILPYLLKSTLAANSFPACVKLAFDSLFGSATNSKLRSLAMQFMHHMCKSTTEQNLTLMAPILRTGFYNIVERPDEEAQMKAMAYTGIGLLAKRSPSHFRKDANHLLRLFKALCEPGVERDVSLAIQECLSLVAPAYGGVSGQPALLLEAALLENVYSATHQARLMAAVLAGSVFPFSHVPSRFVAMVACGDSKEDVREAGKKGLIPPGEEEVKDLNRCRPPSFLAMVAYLHKRANLTLQSDSCYATAAGKLPFAPQIMSGGLRFLCLCLESSAGVTEQQKLTNDMLAPISRYLSELQTTSSEDGSCVDNYFELLQLSLGPAGDLELHSVAMLGLLQLVAACPSQLGPRLKPRLSWIRGFTHSSRSSVHEPAGRLLGLLSRLIGEEEYLTLAEEIYQETWNQTYYIQQGAVVSLGHVTSTGVARLRGKGVESVAMEINHQGKVEIFVKKSLKRLVNLLDTTSSTHLSLLTCVALGEVCRGGPLPLPDEPGAEPSEEEELSKMALIKGLRRKLEGGKEIRLREQCAVALGQMGVAEPDSTHCHTLLEALFSVREEKAVELQFTVGEAIACVAAGPLSTALSDPWSPVPRESHFPADPKVMTWTLDAILRDHAPHPLATIRQAACVWSLCLLKHASRHPNIQKYLKKIQNMFMGLLAESNEVTQEVAARGLGLTYDLCDSSTREEMVQSLVGTLMEGRKIEQKVTEDTEIFQQGELGKVPTGGGLSTYKELCSIASDLNKPDLVYKFMHLANHNALWNSKKGAAFGFSTIAAAAREQLAPHLPALVPRLFRYKYDPNPKVQLAMGSIWSAVVPDSKKAVDLYLPAILNDLSDNLNSGMWRNRQASCMALGDLLVTRLVTEVADHLPSLWDLCLRARDDIKETVRKAANFACSALHKVTIRACESPTAGPKVVEKVLPMLLNKGMQCPSSEVRGISLLAILKISENAGPLLKPHIPLLVPTLLESLSSLEPQELNTITLRLTGEMEAQEKLDSLRVAASKSSPMMEAVRLCIPHVDSEVLAALVPRIVEILKSGVGLGTKTATAQLVVSLVQHSRNDLTPHAGRLLTALTSGLLDRSPGVRKSNARAIGHLVKVSKSASVRKLIEKMKKWYFEKNDSSLHSSLAQVCHAISDHSLDAAQSLLADFLPLVFLAMHGRATPEDPSSITARKLWEETWIEVVPGEAAGVRNYLPELVGVASHALQSQSWPIKAQGAAALATVAEKMGFSLPPEHLATILSVLLEGLHGRTWDGKESLLKALRTVCVRNKAVISSPSTADLPSPHTITASLLTQCKKKQIAYQVVAMDTMGEVASALQVDIFSEFVDIALPILTPAVSQGGRGSEEEGDEEERRAAAELRMLLREKTAEAVGKTWLSQSDTQAAHFSQVLDTLSSALPVSTWKVQLALLSALHSIFSRLPVGQMSEDDVALISTKTIPAVCKCLGNIKFSSLRQKSLRTLENLTTHLHDAGVLTCLPDSTLSELRGCLESVTDRQDKDLASSLLKLLPPSS